MTFNLIHQAMPPSIFTHMRSNGGYARTKDLRRAGIHTRKIKEALEKEWIQRIKPGLYKLRDYPRDEYESFVDIHKANQKGIICLSSALVCHGLTTFNPPKVSVAVPNNTGNFEVNFPPINVFYYRENIYNAGIGEVRRPYGRFKIYNKAKTVCDMFHYRNKVGEDLAFEGLKNYLNEPDANLREIAGYMEICRVKTIMEPYLKAMLAE
jgi:predicted transcriptional regulator of viral defense system